MPQRRASRFALEVLFLIALAVALTLAKLEPLLIGGLMLLGWLIVALLEWAAWRDEPHYGSGLPPRYYVPQVSLPPRQALEQVGGGYPAPERDEAPTWIASAAMRAEVLGEWPVAAPPVQGEDTQADEEADVAIVEELEQVDVAAPEPEVEAPPEAELEPAAVADPTPRRRRLWGRRGDEDDGGDPWEAAELPTEPEETPPTEAAPVGPLPAVATVRTARHRIDPLSEPEPKRRRWHRQGDADEDGYAEVPARPEVRALPGRSRRED